MSYFNSIPFFMYWKMLYLFLKAEVGSFPEYIQVSTGPEITGVKISTFPDLASSVTTLFQAVTDP